MSATVHTTFDLKILSAGALRIGVLQCVEAFSREAGCTVDVRFATSPVLRADVEGGSPDADVVISPVPLQEAFVSAGRTVAGTAIRLGSIRAGIVVHRQAPSPDVASAEALTRSLRRAERIVYNVASSGQYIERMLDRLGLAAELAAKIERVPTSAAVIEAIAAKPDAHMIGFCQSTEIERLAHLGIKMGGHLPASLDAVTTYDAAVSATASAPELARKFVGFLAGPEAKALLRATGVE